MTLRHPHPRPPAAQTDPLSPGQAAQAACRRLLELNAKHGSSLAFIARQHGFKLKLDKAIELAVIGVQEPAPEPPLAILGPGGDFTAEVRP